MFSRDAAERHMKSQDEDETPTILRKIFRVIDPRTGKTFTKEKICSHADEFMYILYLPHLF